MGNDSDVLLRTAEVAERLGWHRGKVERAVRAGDLKPVHRGAGVRGGMLFRSLDVDELAKQRAEAAAR